jgi:hypothetical protein
MDCLFGKQHKVEQKIKPHRANSTTIAAASTLTINPHFAALMATMANFQDEE